MPRCRHFAFSPFHHITLNPLPHSHTEGILLLGTAHRVLKTRLLQLILAAYIGNGRAVTVALVPLDPSTTRLDH